MKCAYCGAENKEDARFCGKCGKPMEQVEKAIYENRPEDTAENSLVEVPMAAGAGQQKKRRRWPIITGIIVLLAAVGTAGILVVRNMQVKRQYNEYTSSGGRYLEELDYEKAEDSYLTAIEIDPKQPDPYRNLIQMYAEQGKYTKAVETAEKAEAALSEGDRQEFEDIIDEWKDVIDYTWIVAPEIEAEDIYYTKSNVYENNSLNGLNRQYMSEYAVIRMDTGLGLIDMNGEIVTDNSYEIIYEEGEWFVLQLEQAVYDTDIGTDCQTYAMKTDGGEIIACPYGIGGGSTDAFYWYQDQLKSIWDRTSASYLKIDGTKGTFPVQNSDELCPENDNYTVYTDNIRWWSSLSGKYAICSEGRLASEFEYDKCGSESEGLLAVEKDGKIGYISTDGKEVIPIEYDASWKQYYSYGNNEVPFAYAVSEGYLPLVKDGMWEMRDTENNVVILPGVFEEIRPVYEGKCWVKKEGKWGVIGLGNINTADSGNQSTTDEAYSENTDGLMQMSEEEILDFLGNQTGKQPYSYRYDDFTGKGDYGIIALYTITNDLMTNTNCEVWYSDGETAEQLYLWEDNNRNSHCVFYPELWYKNDAGEQYLVLNTDQRVALTFQDCMIFGPDSTGKIAKIFEVEGSVELEGEQLVVTENKTEIVDSIPNTTRTSYYAEISEGTLIKGKEY